MNRSKKNKYGCNIGLGARLWGVLLSIGIIGLMGCTDTSLDAQKDVADSLSDEVLSLLSDEANATAATDEPVEGVAVIMMDWVQHELPMREQEVDRSRMIALGFAEPTYLEPPFDAETISMGEVSVTDPHGTDYLLREHLNPRDDIAYIYGMGPKKGPRGISQIPFVVDSDYQVAITGSDTFKSTDLTVQSPVNRIRLIDENFPPELNEDASLTVEWENQDPNLPVGVRVMPARRPECGPAAGQPEERPERAEPILVEAGEQSYTVPPELIKQALADSDGQGIVVHVGQLFHSNYDTDAGLIQVVMRLHDGRMIPAKQ
jgi:hypothetical protein